MTGAALHLTDAGQLFLQERHLATFTTLTADGRPHVTPVGFTWQAGTQVARVITSGTSQKARNARSGGPVVLCQVDGRRWLSLEGRARVSSEEADVARAVALYAQRYRPPRANPTRVVIEVQVSRLMGSTGLLGARGGEPPPL